MYLRQAIELFEKVSFGGALFELMTNHYMHFQKTNDAIVMVTASKELVEDLEKLYHGAY